MIWFTLAHAWAPLELTRSVPSVDDPVFADLDGDGDLDLVVSVTSLTPLLWSENDGGVLGVPVPVTYDEERVTDIVAADLDGDGGQDLLVTRPEGTVWYRSLGAGLWEPASTIDSAFSFATAAADVDGDGDLDVVVTDLVGDTWGWAENLGGGTFAAVQSVAAIAGPGNVAAADLNGDGLDDVVIYGLLDEVVHRFDSTGSGFSAGVEVVTGVGADTDGMELELVDIDGSGTIDLLVAASDGLVLYADTVAGPGTWLSAPTQGAMALAVADIDANGVLDVVGSVYDRHYYTPTYSLEYEPQLIGYRGLGGGVFDPGGLAVTGDDQRDLALGDVDGDGLPELVAALGYDGILGVHDNNGAGFNNLRSDLGAWCEDVEQLVPADLDGDGDEDLVAVCGGWGVVWFEQLGGQFGPQQEVLELEVPTDAGAGDFDGDGDVDLVVCERTEVHLLDATAAGFVQSTVTAAGAFPGNCGAMAVVDLDMDGDPDVVTTDLGAVRVWENAGGLQPGLSMADGVGFIDSIGVGDLDADGWPDLVTADGGEVSVHLGNGALGFVTSLVEDVPASIGELVVADVDGDGLLDIVGATYDATWWWAGLGGGAFAPAALVGPSEDAESLAVFDHDGDGDLDVAVGSRTTDDVVLYDNLGASFAAAEIVYEGVPWPADLVPMDGNDDGDVDLFLAFNTNDSVLQLSNPRLEPVDSDGDGFAFSDCDDVDPLINPDALEVCDDGIDQDCDGSDLPCNAPTDTGLEEPTDTGLSTDTGLEEPTGTDTETDTDTDTTTDHTGTGPQGESEKQASGCGCDASGGEGWAGWYSRRRR